MRTDLTGSLRRILRDLSMGQEPAAGDLRLAMRERARRDGCTCDPDQLDVEYHPPGAGESRPTVLGIGHRSSCTALLVWSADPN